MCIRDSENAVRHGRRGGEARITLRASGGDALIRVSNDGRRVAPEALARLTEPFERLERGRAEGSGLGLSIVRAIVEAHGGSLRFSALATGGLDVQVRLPCAVVTST